MAANKDQEMIDAYLERVPAPVSTGSSKMGLSQMMDELEEAGYNVHGLTNESIERLYEDMLLGFPEDGMDWSDYLGERCVEWDDDFEPEEEDPNW